MLHAHGPHPIRHRRYTAFGRPCGRVPVTAPPQIHMAQTLHVASARDLLINLVHAELTARYKTAVFGLLWFLLNPVVLAAVLVTVFQSLIRLPIERYPIFLLVALLPWTFFQTGVGNATVALTRAQALVKRVRIPRMLVPLSTILASLVHLLISLALLLAVLAVMGRLSFGPALLFLPVLVVLELACVVGIGLAVASVNVLFRDVEHVVAMLLRFGFWLTPIFYPLDYVPERWRPLMLVNPMVGLLEGFRAVIVQGTTPPAAPLLVSAAISAACLIGGVVIFRRLDPHLDDYV